MTATTPTTMASTTTPRDEDDGLAPSSRQQQPQRPSLMTAANDVGNTDDHTQPLVAANSNNAGNSSSSQNGVDLQQSLTAAVHETTSDNSSRSSVCGINKNESGIVQDAATTRMEDSPDDHKPWNNQGCRKKDGEQRHDHDSLVVVNEKRSGQDSSSANNSGSAIAGPVPVPVLGTTLGTVRSLVVRHKQQQEEEQQETKEEESGNDEATESGIQQEELLIYLNSTTGDTSRDPPPELVAQSMEAENAGEYLVFVPCRTFVQALRSTKKKEDEEEGGVSNRSTSAPSAKRRRGVTVGAQAKVESGAGRGNGDNKGEHESGSMRPSWPPVPPAPSPPTPIDGAAALAGAPVARHGGGGRGGGEAWDRLAGTRGVRSLLSSSSSCNGSNQLPLRTTPVHTAVTVIAENAPRQRGGDKISCSLSSSPSSLSASQNAPLTIDLSQGGDGEMTEREAQSTSMMMPTMNRLENGSRVDDSSANRLRSCGVTDNNDHIDHGNDHSNNNHADDNNDNDHMGDSDRAAIAGDGDSDRRARADSVGVVVGALVSSSGDTGGGGSGGAMRGVAAPAAAAATPMTLREPSMWSCGACTLDNKKSARKCAACGTPKPQDQVDVLS